MRRTLTRRAGPGGMVIEELGSGPPLMFVHGSGEAGARAWRAQRPLAARWRLVFPARPGYGESSSSGREDFEVDAAHIAELLGNGAHLVGHDYGGVVALLAAALRPQAVWTLAVVEAPASGVARGDPVVEEFERGLTRALASNVRPPSEAVIPTASLQSAPFPKLFLTGGHNPAYEIIADELAFQLGGERRVLPGAGHAPQTMGERFNVMLEAFMRAESY